MNETMTGTLEKVVTSPPRPDRWLGVRHLQTFLIFLLLLVAYTLRVNMSVAIVAMIDKENANPDFEEYPWSEGTKAIILSSFFWGYVVTQVPAGQLAERFGPKWTLLGAMLMTSFFAIMTPWAAAWGGWPFVCGVRVLQGLGQGFIFPSAHCLLAKWSPVKERGRLVTIAYSGCQFGTFLALPVCGILSTSTLGWPSAFYIFGLLGMCWCVLWAFLGSNSPCEHSFISDQEAAYIEGSVTNSTEEHSKPPTPWKSIFTSLPMWAIIVAHCGHGWGFWTLLTEMPTYMKTVLNFDLKANGLLSALPYFVMWILGFVFSFLSDVVRRKKLLPLRTSRKFFNCIAHWGAAASLVGLAFTTDPTLATTLLTIAVGLLAATYVGFNVNHIDLAPNFAGTMMGITNGAGNVMSLLAPLIVGVIVTESGSESQWQIVFFISAGIFFVCNLFFIIFAKAELQPWNDPLKPSPESILSTIYPVKSYNGVEHSATTESSFNRKDS